MDMAIHTSSVTAVGYLAAESPALSPCVIITPVWSSWLQLLPFLSLQCIELYVSDPSCPWFLQWGLTLHPITTVTLDSSRLSDPT
jgi:hypothetical protein